MDYWLTGLATLPVAAEEMQKLLGGNSATADIGERLRSVAGVTLMVLMVLLALPVCLLWVWPKWYLQGLYERFQQI